MKFSQRTLDILKNFSSINQSIQFRKGNVIRTTSPITTILAEANIDETIPDTFAVYDLNKFLSKVNMYGSPEIKLRSDSVVMMSDDGRRVDYIKFCDPSAIVVAPDKTLKLPSVDAEFDFELADLIWHRKSGGISGAPHLVFEMGQEGVSIKSTDVTNNAFDMTVTTISSTPIASEFRCIIKVENFKVIDDSYHVQICKGKFVKLTGRTKGVTYYVAIEAEK